MGLKSYIIATILLIILLFGFVFSLELGDYTLNKFDYSYTLPIAVWFVLPLIFLSLVTYLHIIFYSLINHYKAKLSLADQDDLVLLLKDKLLEKSNKLSFRTKKFREIAAILGQLNIGVKKESFSSSNEDLNKVVTAVQNINNGIYVSSKTIKIDEISSLAKKNLLNKISEQVDFAVDVVKKAEKYESEAVKAALLKVIDEKSITTVKKIYKNVVLDKDLVFALLEKNQNNEEFGFTNDEILDILKSVKFTEDEYLSLAKNCKSSLTPDSLIYIFEKLSISNEDATVAYLYILNELEMNDKLREILQNSQSDEYLVFKALIDLKDAGKHYNLENMSSK